MNNQKLSTIALFICFLVIMLPVIQAQELAGENSNNNTSQQITINANIPRYVRETVIDVFGTSAPNSVVELYIKTVKKRQVNSTTDGRFAINAVHLSETDNEVLLKSTDVTGNTAQQTYTVTVDTEVPKFTITNFSAISTQQVMEVKAQTSKPVNVSYTAKQISDKTPPDKILNLQKDRIEETGIAIAWDASSALDFGEYAIYRNNKRIASTTAPNYLDTQINSDTEYDYRISAVDKNCNIGAKSDVLITKSLKSGKADIQEPQEAKLNCEPEQKTLQVENSGTFTIPIQLQDGLNEVIITATDLAGHKITYKNTTALDSILPQILETNLEQLSPTYIPDVKIKGILNKKATVFAYINDDKKPTAYALANDDGTFEIAVQLRRETKLTKGQRNITLETGEGWENRIKIEALDAAGRKTAPINSKITYSICGFGNWFDVKLGEPSPKKLTPRFLLQGIQEAGLTFNATYKGNYNVTLGQITAGPLMLSPDLEEEYDNGLVDLNILTQAQNQKSILGYVQLMFRKFTFSDDNKLTDYDREKNISMHRASNSGPEGKTGMQKDQKGKSIAPYVSSQYKNCLTPGIGCMKLFLEINIPFQEKIPKQIIDPMTQRTLNKFDLQNHVQKVCMPIELAMDVPVPPNFIPRNFLKAAIEFLDRAVDAMDTILDPLTTVGTYVLYSCLAGTAWLYIDLASETISCDILPTVNAVAGKGAFDKEIAKAGLCKDAYGSGTEEYKNCDVCSQKIKNSKEFQYDYLQPICDRVACPSAPTLQSQIRNAEDLEPITGLNEGSDSFKKWNVGGKLYSGDDCAFGPYQEENLKKLSLTYEDLGAALGIKKIYDYAKDKPTIPPSGPDKKACQNYLRPAHPNCCGVSYMQEWASACGPAPFVDTFDELKESTCLAAQKVNKKTIDPELQCGGPLNAVAGFCEPDSGGEVVDPIPTGIKYIDTPTSTTKPASARTNEVYILVVPSTMFKKRGGTTSEQTDYRVYRGYVAERFMKGTAKEEKNKYLKQNPSRIEYDVNPKTSVISDGVDLTKFFNQEKKEGKELKQYTPEFTQALCKDVDTLSCTQAKAKEAYERVYERIGASDKEYIVKPDEEGLLRSFQCVCLPALTSYLQFWRNIMGVVRDCFKTILLTGDGSEGICKATLSTYVCDLLFDVVKCFVQKFNAPGGGARSGFGIGDFAGALAKAGTETQRRVQGRYGETALWKAMFVDRKLIHSICAFAFTGTWNFDVSSIFSQTVASIPTQSQGFLTPCTRQFISFSPTTEPKGKTTWTYHFGVGLAAGADVRYDLILKCSDGFRCDPSDGFKNGECDCNKKGELLRTISAPELGIGQLKKNDILNKEVFYTIQSDTPDSAVRYDKAILRYSYIDPKNNKEVTDQTSCDIKLSGGDAPNFCQFDPFSLSYRCQFGVGESAIRLEKAEPVYSKVKDITPVFGIAENIKLSLSIRQQQSQERTRALEGTKFILYKVKNQYGKIVDELSEQSSFLQDYTLKGTGSYSKEINIAGAITEANFASPTTGAGFSQQLLEKGTVVRKTTDLIGGFSATEQVPFIIRIQNGRFGVFEGSDSIRDGKFVEVISIPQAQNIDITPSIGRPQVFTYTKTTGLGTETKTVIFTINQNPIFTEGDIIIIQQPKTANPCAGITDAKGVEDYGKRPVVSWTVELEIHDADRNGRPTAQVSIDPATGQPARADVRINVMCVAGANIPGLTKIIPPKEEGRCESLPYIKNSQPCYCGEQTGYNAPNCGDETNGLYCLNNKGCSKVPECNIATNPSQPIQDNCKCIPDQTRPTANKACEKKSDKAVYCCNTPSGIDCVDEFSKCTPKQAI